MKHATTLIATLAVLLTAACTGNDAMKKTDPAYIGPSGIQVPDGRMSPEVLLSLGRLSDPQLSPDGQSILYGVSYNSIEDNRSCRNL